MGNQLFKNYDVEKEPSCVGGQNGLWKIYSAVKQDSSKRKVSIWTFDKKGIKDKSAKLAKDEISQFLKKESTSLVKIRHPNIVNIVEPLVEDKDSMAFVTERVDDNLFSLMKKNEFNLICQSELELKLQVESLLKVLSFLHNDVKMAHLGLSPENIFIVNGQWKLAGFTFATSLQNAQSANNTQDVNHNPCVDVNNADYTKRPFDSFCQFFPNLTFSAPEVAEVPPKCTAASDIFSLALLLLLMFQIKYMQTTSVIPALNSKQIGEYSHQLANLQNHFKTQNYIQKDMSEDFKKLVSKMLAKNTATRPTIEQIKQSPWLNDPFVKAIYMLENIVELDQNKQIAFLTGMSNILFKYEKLVIRNRILPQLLDLAKFEYLIPAILNVVVDCLKQPDLFTIAEFQQALAPFVLSLTKRKSIPGKALCSLVMNCETFHKFFDKNDFQNVYLVPVFKCFDIPQLQTYALQQSTFLISKLDYIVTKNKLLPKILTLCTSNVPKIMKLAVMTLQKIIGNLDKNVLNDQVLQTLEKLRKTPIQDKALTMIILDIYQSVAKSLDIQVIAQKILPNLIPYLIDQTLGQKEFNAYLTAVNVLIKQIETERIKQIKDLGSVADQDVKIEEDLLFDSNKSTAADSSTFSQLPAKGKEFDFLSIFDEKPKSSGSNSNIASQNAPSDSSSQQKQQQQQPSILENNSGLFQAASSMPAKPSVLQMDFNFDMFDNPATPTAEISNVAISNSNATSNPTGINFNPPQPQTKESAFPSIVYKDPFANQKLSKNIDAMFPSQPNQPDFFNNFQSKDQPSTSFPSGIQSTSMPTAFEGNFNPLQNNNGSMNVTSNNNKYSAFNSITDTSNSSIVPSIQQNNSVNPGAKPLFANLKQQTNSQSSAGLQQQQQYPPIAQQGTTTSWGMQDDPFKDLLYSNQADLNTTQQSVNASSMNLLQQQNNNNFLNNNTGYNDDLFGGLTSACQTSQSLFSNLKKNNSGQKNNNNNSNAVEDLFGNNNPKVGGNSSNNFELL